MLRSVFMINLLAKLIFVSTLYGEMATILNEIAEQFLVALVVPVTIQALSVLLIGLLMDVM